VQTTPDLISWRKPRFRAMGKGGKSPVAVIPPGRGPAPKKPGPWPFQRGLLWGRNQKVEGGGQVRSARRVNLTECIVLYKCRARVGGQRGGQFELRQRQPRGRKPHRRKPRKATSFGKRPLPISVCLPGGGKSIAISNPKERGGRPMAPQPARGDYLKRGPSFTRRS